MKRNNPVFRETAVIALGEVIGAAVIFGVFALLGRFNVSVLLGGLLGGVLTTLNFFLLGVGVSNAADKAENGDPKAGQRAIQLSFLVRTFALFGILIVAALSKVFNLWALLIPLCLERPILYIAEFFRKAGDSREA